MDYGNLDRASANPQVPFSSNGNHVSLFAKTTRSYGTSAVHVIFSATDPENRMTPVSSSAPRLLQRTVLEILTGNAARQTVMPPSFHPVGREYEWMTGDGIVPARDLPVLADHHFEQLEDTLEHIGWAGDIALPTRDRADRETARDTDDPNIWRDTNNRALANLDAWVGSLGLPKLRRHPNGAWEAVPDWRASNEGRPTMQRKPNLKFHASGIKDMGTDIGYTALDVVGAAKAWDFDTSFGWLRGQLGMNIDVGPLPEKPRRIIKHNDGLLSDEETGEVIPPVASISSPDRNFPDHLTRAPGLLGEMIEYIVETSTSPNRTLALGSALVCLGTIIGRRDATPTGSGTHLYVIALAGSGVGKDHPQKAGKALLRAAVSDHPGVKLVGAPDFMSQSAIVRELKKNQLQASFVDEFGDFLQRVNARNAPTHERNIKGVLLTAWGRSFDVLETPAWAAEGSSEIYSPAHSIFGASTPGKFYAALQTDDRENGFLNRMLLLPTFAKVEARDPAYDYRKVPPPLAEKLKAAYRARRPQIEINPEMQVVEWEDGNAKAAWDAFRKECVDREDDSVFYKRSAEMAARLATIRAVGRDIDFPSVSLDDVVWGIEVARWSAQRMAEDAGAEIADTPAGIARAKIMAKINAHPERRVAWSKFMKDLGMTSKDLRAHVADMKEIGQLEEQIITPASRGRPGHYLAGL